MLESVQIVAVSRAEIVENTDLRSLFLIVLDDVGSDEAGSAGDEYLHDSMIENGKVFEPVTGSDHLLHLRKLTLDRADEGELISAALQIVLWTLDFEINISKQKVR
jgi:hypothetical protein